jgi:hypothetical protein
VLFFKKNPVTFLLTFVFKGGGGLNWLRIMFSGGLFIYGVEPSGSATKWTVC